MLTVVFRLIIKLYSYHIIRHGILTPGKKFLKKTNKLSGK